MILETASYFLSKLKHQISISSENIALWKQKHGKLYICVCVFKDSQQEKILQYYRK